MQDQNRQPKIWAVVPAAGSGQRMQSDLAKQYLKIDGKTVLEITLGILLNQTDINKIVVCLAGSDTNWKNIGLSKNPLMIEAMGGDTRAQSVLNGLAALEAKADVEDWVLVHDAARPCLKPRLLQKLISTLIQSDDGGILAVPVKDTLKVSEKSNSHSQIEERIQKSLDRSNVWHAQTPQMFRYGALKTALTHAIEDKQFVTDEASAMELAGYHPVLIEGDYSNIKITNPEDLKLAKFLMNEDKLNL